MCIRDSISRGTSDHERDFGERNGRKRLLLSDHGDEYAGQLWSDRIGGGANDKQRDGFDHGDTHDGGNVDRDAERNEQRWNRQRNADAHHRSGNADH